MSSTKYEHKRSSSADRVATDMRKSLAEAKPPQQNKVADLGTSHKQIYARYGVALGYVFMNGVTS